MLLVNIKAGSTEECSDTQTLRGKMWRTFLGLESVKQEGYYEQLVYQALGSKYSKQKVATCAVLQLSLQAVGQI